MNSTFLRFRKDGIGNESTDLELAAAEVLRSRVSLDLVRGSQCKIAPYLSR
jgi:hypothetical protein